MAPSGLYARLCHAFLVHFYFWVNREQLSCTISTKFGVNSSSCFPFRHRSPYQGLSNCEGHNTLATEARRRIRHFSMLPK